MDNQSDTSLFASWCDRESVRRNMRGIPFDSQMFNESHGTLKAERRQNPRTRFVPANDPCLQV
jgi:hypothetical protein